MRRGAWAAAALAAAALAAAAAALHSEGERAAARGAAFGEELASIQEGLEREQASFAAALAGGPDAAAAAAGAHEAAMGGLLARYGGLEPPAGFAGAVELFRLSTEAQLERDREELLWLRTGLAEHRSRADSLHQEAFQYELEALAAYKAAQRGAAP